MKRIQKELTRQRYAPVVEIIHAITGYWQNSHGPLSGPGISEPELTSYINVTMWPKRIVALCQLGCSLEDLAAVAAENFVPGIGRLSEVDQLQRGEQIAELVTARAELCVQLVEATKAEAVLDETTGAEVVAWTRPPERPVVAIDHLRGDSWLAERDRREKLLAHWQKVWSDCRPVSILPEASLPARLLEWHSNVLRRLGTDPQESGMNPCDAVPDVAG